VPTAGTVCRLGWCAALEQLGIPYLLVSARDVSRTLPGLPNPFCWIAGSDYAYLSEAGLAALRRTRHMVWVDTWFKDEMQFRARHDLPPNTLPDEVRERVVSSEPAFVFTISPQASFEYYDLWSERGLNLVSLPLACDATRYPSEPPHVARFDGVEMAFVGGYWPYKARQFDRYLKPYQDRLTVYGWSRWPYAGFGGPLPSHEEASLYHQACLSPTVNEPHVEFMGVDLNERVFKVLGSGGLTVTDAVPAYAEWFSPDELLISRSPDEFHETVRMILSDTSAFDEIRRRGQRAVLERHTYVHRAELALRLLAPSIPTLIASA
jgi:hypothetical protein